MTNYIALCICCLRSVLLLGNHSSGKSSFINYVLGREVQTTGVAPTDDGFTVIAPGDEDTDRDGASFIGDPTLGFSPLRSFGPAFMNHFQLKVRKDLTTNSLLLVDSPGMIDSPAALGSMYGGAFQRAAAATSSSAPSAADRSTAERGYDFLRVTRWLAEQSDVILLFFDPDKPGTTGETLECLTTSLSGMEHKLHIVMNKVDQFVHIHDFARAYGSLCWNLSKVIPRKDLPRIYTMFLPPEARPAASPAPSVAADASSAAASSLSHALAELNATREEVMHAVHSAPERRVDNLITRAHDAAALLRMHSVVLEEARSQYATLRMRYLAAVSTLVAAAPCAGYAAFAQFDVTLQLSGALGVAITGLGGIVAVQMRAALADTRTRLTSEAGLDAIFESLHAVELRERDEFVHALWRRVRPQLQDAISTVELHALERLSAAELGALDDILAQRIPELRRMTSAQPAHAAASVAAAAARAAEAAAAKPQTPGR